jgi:PAS domain S-box-containing protein
VSAAARWRRSHRAKLVEEIPCGVVVIDRNLVIVDHNRAFAEIFGEAVGRTCFLATRNRNEPCANCPAARTFADGQPRVIEQNGTDRQGRPTHYLVQLTPVREGDRVQFVAATTTDLTATRRLQREYQTLFEKVPCLRRGDQPRLPRGQGEQRCSGGCRRGNRRALLHAVQAAPRAVHDLPAQLTFGDGASHSAAMVGTSRDGIPTTTWCPPPAAARRRRGHPRGRDGVDVTEAHQLEQELAQAHVLREALVETSLDAIVVLDDRGRVKLFNRAAEGLWGYAAAEVVGKRVPPQMIPSQLHSVCRGAPEQLVIHDTLVRRASGDEVPARVAAVTLRAGTRILGTAVVAQDLAEIKRLEREKVDAERLAAVGQTVAGLAHGIKNILTGLEGGMYVTSTGLRKGDDQRVRQGWEMLERNMGRISTLVKSLLAFSRGETPRVAMVDPVAVAREVVQLYRETADQHGVTLEAELDTVLAPAPMDGEGIHTCLTNLLSNALDACLVAHNPSCRVTIRVTENAGVIAYEVGDTGCGMDYEAKQKAFTSFFSTKGAGGTGLGLLVTRKIVQQHGGTVTFESTAGQGTVFRLQFPRARLPQPAADEIASGRPETELPTED